MASQAQIRANRANAKKSTGPRTINGKGVSSRNATKHGLFSKHLFADAEEQEAFQVLWDNLRDDLRPAGPIEEGLVERIAINMWRQRRLNTAEGAMTRLNVRVDNIAHQKCQSPPYGNGDILGSLGIQALTEERTHSAEDVSWSQRVLDEIDAISECSFSEIEETAPTVFADIQYQADQNDLDVAKFLSAYEGNLPAFVRDLSTVCKNILDSSQERLAEQQLTAELQKKALLLPKQDLDLIARYQTTLDNQLFKLLKEFREQQAWRMKTLELEVAELDGSD